MSKDCVTTSIKQVMDFFFTGKSFKGKLFTKKSTSKVVHVNRQSRESEMLDQVSDFSDQRGEESPMIVSCDDHAKKELCHAMAEPYLIISNTDLNTCNFSKCLGNIMLETRPNLFLETSNLSTVGRGRVEKVITDIRQLFDNRLRVFMFGSSTLEHLSERRFAAHDETELFDQESSQNSQIIEPQMKGESLLSKDVLLEALKESHANIDKLKENNKLLESNISAVKDEYEAALKVKESLIKDRDFELELLQSKYNSLLDRMDVIEKGSAAPVSFNVETQTDDTMQSSTNAIDKECQTKRVVIDMSPLTYLKQKILRSSEVSNMSKVVKSIKNFSFKAHCSQQLDGKFTCNVVITSGKHITDHKRLLTAKGVGLTEVVAKDDAFKMFIDNLIEEADK